jgi:hypothetical protein
MRREIPQVKLSLSNPTKENAAAEAAALLCLAANGQDLEVQLDSQLDLALAVDEI